MAVHAGSVTAAVQVVFVAAQAEFPAPGPGTDPGGTLVIVTIDRLSKEIGDGGAIAIDRAVGFVTVGAGKNAILLISPQIGVFQAAPVSRCRNKGLRFRPEDSHRIHPSSIRRWPPPFPQPASSA